jgi:hypothetical protein
VSISFNIQAVTIVLRIGSKDYVLSTPEEDAGQVATGDRLHLRYGAPPQRPITLTTGMADETFKQLARLLTSESPSDPLRRDLESAFTNAVDKLNTLPVIKPAATEIKRQLSSVRCLINHLEIDLKKDTEQNAQTYSGTFIIGLWFDLSSLDQPVTIKLMNMSIRAAGARFTLNATYDGSKLALTGD